MDKIKILVVDDEARMRKLVKDFLSIKGYQVLEGGDGEEAADLFFQQGDIASRTQSRYADVFILSYDFQSLRSNRTG